MATSIEDLARMDPEDIFRHLTPNRITDTDRKYLDEVLADGFHNTGDPGDIYRRLESAFAEKFQCEYGILHNSGTGTLQTCLLAAGVGPGDEVIVPPLTAASTAFVVVQCGAVPVFADVDGDTFNMDPADVERKITEFTRAIIPVALYGLSPDYDRLMPLAQKHNLTVVEDNAQCFLGTYKGRLVGTIGHAASFSFQASKHMTTGDGGMVVTNDAEYARDIRKRSAVGFRTLGAKPGDVFVPRDVRQDWDFDRHDVAGYNFRLPAVAAAIGLGQLERLDTLVAARLYCARQYRAVLDDEKCQWLIPPHVPEGCGHSYWTWVCKLDEARLGVDWRTFRGTYIANGGDGLYSAWKPLHLEPVFRDMNFVGRSKEQSPNFDPRYKGKVKSYQKGDCPVVEAIQPCLCQFKTSMQTRQAADDQAEALRKTIRHYNG